MQGNIEFFIKKIDFYIRPVPKYFSVFAYGKIVWNKWNTKDWNKKIQNKFRMKKKKSLNAIRNRQKHTPIHIYLETGFLLKKNTYIHTNINILPQ